MSTSRGFALVAVLWVVVALAGLALAATSHGAVAAAGTEARTVRIRGRWAAEACLAAAHAALEERAAAGRALSPIRMDTIPLAGGGRCAVHMREAPDSQSPAPRVLVTARGWLDGRPGAATIDLLIVSAGTRVAAVRRRVW